MTARAASRGTQTRRIYEGYRIYHQSNGLEQSVFAEGPAPVARSALLLDRLLARFAFPERGRLLDVGCGNGSLLRAFSSLMPSWTLAGTELDDRHRAEVEEIAGVEALYVCPPDGVPGCFALITLVHVLEHVPAPWRWMARLVRKLDEDVLVQVPDYRQNPFDLLIADHCTHFSWDVLEEVVRRAGFEPLLVADDWVEKEVSVVARRGRTRREESAPSRCSETLAGLRGRVEWLNAVRDVARRASLLGPFGVFGTSIAGT